MTRITLWSAVFLWTAAALGASPAGRQSPPGASTAVIVTMTAKTYEFDPAVITVKQGDRVKLVITAIDREHGIKLTAYDINQKLQKGVPATIEFTADKPGTFPFECSVFCGLGHRHMKGKLVVEAAAGSASTSTP